MKKIPLLLLLITYFIRFVFSAYIPYSARIGKGAVLGYGGLGIVLLGRSVLGSNCHIDQNVTISGTSKKYDVPVLGNNVYVSAGAKIFGQVRIGNEIVVGANSVVLKDVPDNSVVVGNPSRIVKTGIKMKDYV